MALTMHVHTYTGIGIGFKLCLLVHHYVYIPHTCTESCIDNYFANCLVSYLLFMLSGDDPWAATATAAATTTVTSFVWFINSKSPF